MANGVCYDETMTAFTSVVIIYNPNSTGNSKSNAKKLESKLKKILPHLAIKAIPTKYAGHAEKLACSLASSRKKPLIVSSSGDGGYHEVINGIMAVSAKGGSAIAAVLPAGNANDHSRTMHKRPLWQAIQKGKVIKIDLLKVTIKSGGNTQVRYAHSYVGLGLTPAVATELNRHTLNAFKEISLLLKTFFKYRPFKIRRRNKITAFDSLIFANINQMAKVLTLSQKNKPDDGLFEVISFPHAHKLLLIRKLFRAATTGLQTTRRQKRYSFETIKKMPMQLDGEITRLAAGAEIEIVAVKKALRTIV